MTTCIPELETASPKNENKRKKNHDKTPNKNLVKALHNKAESAKIKRGENDPTTPSIQPNIDLVTSQPVIGTRKAPPKKKYRYKTPGMILPRSIPKTAKSVKKIEKISEAPSDLPNLDTGIVPNQSITESGTKQKNKKEGRKGKNSEVGVEYTLIKDIKHTKKQKIERVLPHWLLHPIAIPRNLKHELKSPTEACPILHPKLVENLKKNNVVELFPVQQIVIPHVLKGVTGMENRFRPRDICVATPTGSGKTLAYVLSIIQALSSKTIPVIRALIILPVIELAKQVHSVFSIYAPQFNLKVGQAFGLGNLMYEQKLLVQRVYGNFQSKVDILIATPGRLASHLAGTPGLDFSELRFLVLDEADKLIAADGGELISRIQRHILEQKPQQTNLGLSPLFPLQTLSQKEFPFEEQTEVSVLDQFSDFHSDVDSGSKEVSKTQFLSIPSPPMQRLLFSATLSHDPQQLQNIDLYRPVLFTCIGEESNPDEEPLDYVRPLELSEEVQRVKANLKPLVLHFLLRTERKRAEKSEFRAMVFANSLEVTSKITVLLKAMSKGKYIVQEFSSKYKNARDTILRQFLKGKINVLVSSDAMARGIDVPNVDCIISYDVPSANTYIHRIGRTARAGRPGKAISLVTDSELRHLKRNLGKHFDGISQQEINENKLKKFEATFQSALTTLSEAVNTKGKNGPLIPRTLKRKGTRNNKI